MKRLKRSSMWCLSWPTAASLLQATLNLTTTTMLDHNNHHSSFMPQFICFHHVHTNQLKIQDSLSKIQTHKRITQQIQSLKTPNLPCLNFMHSNSRFPLFSFWPYVPVITQRIRHVIAPMWNCLTTHWIRAVIERFDLVFCRMIPVMHCTVRAWGWKPALLDWMECECVDGK